MSHLSRVTSDGDSAPTWSELGVAGGGAGGEAEEFDRSEAQRPSSRVMICKERSTVSGLSLNRELRL